MKMKISWQYEFKGRKTAFESDWLNKEHVLPIIEDLTKTGRMKSTTITDELLNEWTVKEFIKLNKKLDDEPGEVEVYFDGGFDRQTQTAGIGVVVFYKQNGDNWRYRVNERLVQLESNNEAEYAALYKAVELLETIGVKQVPVTFTGDSQVVLKQLSGEWPCFDEGLNKWLDRIENKVEKLGITPLYKPVDRRQNKEADKLANQALQEIFVHSHSVIS
ncbi:reverse transcriptase-like protein [Bacillus aerolatus]|uniref:Reverse transcriptase-like protein n=1 Tax=Bacillus aerolatus TaxID=2653354 RepID=A0A6I1FQH6_9BACI|nr:reverse transcriptase-like protein [Bacillus aerolatus]KAB7708974.1 reverse transcriptase-like protein [Bacillus aerolatus]